VTGTTKVANLKIWTAGNCPTNPNKPLKSLHHHSLKTFFTMTTMTTQLAPATPAPSILKRLLNWFRGIKPAVPATTDLAPAQSDAAEQEVPRTSDWKHAATPAQPATGAAITAIRKLMEADHSARGYHEGYSRGDKHFMALSIAEICATFEESILDVLEQHRVQLAKLELERQKLLDADLHDMALKFWPRMLRTQAEISALEVQLELVTQGKGWAQQPVMSYKNGFRKALHEKAQQVLEQLSKPLI
jgi:hypothetical protein